MRFEEILDVSTSAERVYNYLTYPDTLPDLDPDIVYWEPEELPPRVGTVNKMKWRVFGVPTFIELSSRYAEVDPPRHFVIEGVRPRFVDWRWTMDLVELPNGVTRGTSKFELDVPAWTLPLSRMVLSYLHRGAHRSMQASLSRLGEPRRNDL
jgi:ligand-binding SRPBCC domain-containing protein